MRRIFNSLGSNYNFSFAMKALFSNGQKCDKLTKKLEDKYNGRVLLTYKGREAFEIALKSLSLPLNSKIAICGFTCYSVYQSIKNQKYDPLYLDLEKGEINFSKEALENAYSKEKNIKVVVVQNTLGYPCDIEKINQFCKEKSLFLIEDIAHCAGTIYENSQESGTVGDITLMSFGQDKIIDGISGGAVIFRNKDIPIPKINFEKISLFQNFIDRFYPINSLIIRKLYFLPVLGKAFHRFLKVSNLLPKPVIGSGKNLIRKMPNFYCRLVVDRLSQLKADLDHRKKIAWIYYQNLSKDVLITRIDKTIDNSTNLRFPIIIKNRDKLISKLRSEGFYLADIWYDAPIAPKKYIFKTDYKKGNCKNSEELSENIFNLPTHKNINEKDAFCLTKIINDWLKNEM